MLGYIISSTPKKARPFAFPDYPSFSPQGVSPLKLYIERFLPALE